MKYDKLYKIIDLYYEAQLSSSEEDELFHALLAFEEEDSKVKEALAVMLMARNPEILAAECAEPTILRPANKRWHSTLRPAKYAAAVVLTVIACVTALLYHSYIYHSDENEGMMAYVRGVRISDHSEIMKIVDEQLYDISMSSELLSQTVATDLDDIRNAFNEEDI